MPFLHGNSWYYFFTNLPIYLHSIIVRQVSHWLTAKMYIDHHAALTRCTKNSLRRASQSIYSTSPAHSAWQCMKRSKDTVYELEHHFASTQTQLALAHWTQSITLSLLIVKWKNSRQIFLAFISLGSALSIRKAGLTQELGINIPRRVF